MFEHNTCFWINSLGVQRQFDPSNFIIVYKPIAHILETILACIDSHVDWRCNRSPRSSIQLCTLTIRRHTVSNIYRCTCINHFSRWGHSDSLPNMEHLWQYLMGHKQRSISWVVLVLLDFSPVQLWDKKYLIKLEDGEDFYVRQLLTEVDILKIATQKGWFSELSCLPVRRRKAD